MTDGTTITILIGGIWVTLIFIVGVGWRILKELQKLSATAVGGSSPGGGPSIGVTIKNPPPPTP